MSAPQFIPYRPRAIAALNWIGRRFENLGLEPDLDPEALLLAAQRRTALSDFGDESFRPGFEVLARSADTEARLHPFGRWVARERLISLLVTRLRVAALLRAHPEILRQRIEAPVVIAGLQRTGTTLLHRLLAADPDTRALLSWEALSPTVHPRQKPKRPDRRIRAARTAERALAYLAPEFFAIHPVQAEAPEEDVLLMEYSFRSQVPEATMHVPTYATWLAEQDPRPAYEYLIVLLKVLQWQRGARRWVLKTPAHLEHLDMLLQVFPSAKIVQTHRDPMRTAGSFASMLAHGYGVFSDQVDASEIAQRWTSKNAAMVKCAMRVRERFPEAFIDVSYYDLIDDPMAQVKRIYAHAGIEMSDTAREAISANSRRNPQNRHGRHRYSLGDFGLSEELIESEYGDYRSRFEIPNEAAAP